MAVSIYRICVLLALAVVCSFFTVHAGKTICVPRCTDGGPSIRSRRDLQELDRELLRRGSGALPSDGPARFRGYDLDELAAAATRFRRTLYGDNDIDDPMDVSHLPMGVRANIAGVVAIMQRSQLNEKVTPTLLMAETTAATAENLCPRERFRDQIVAAQCTGYLIAPDLVVTASHCFKSNNSGSLRFVFGFEMTKSGPKREYGEGDVRHGVIAYRSSPCLRPERDFVVYQLTDADDNSFPVSHRPLVRAKDVAHSGDRVYMLGFPLGTPLKYSRNARVRAMVNDVFFKANLDGYDHNSGSPVFSRDHEIIGMHVRGVKALFNSCGCERSTACPNNGCDGEDATHISHLPSIADIRETIRRIKEDGYEPPTGDCEREHCDSPCNSQLF